jgi:hypothetical protein
LVFSWIFAGVWSELGGMGDHGQLDAPMRRDLITVATVDLSTVTMTSTLRTLPEEGKRFHQLTKSRR